MVTKLTPIFPATQYIVPVVFDTQQTTVYRVDQQTPEAAVNRVHQHVDGDPDRKAVVGEAELYIKQRYDYDLDEGDYDWSLK